MKIEELKQTSLKIFDVIFSKQKTVTIENQDYKIGRFSRGIKYVDAFGYRFIEQNPHKKSEWGKKARQGHKIMWVIKGSKYIAQVLDGEFKTLK